MADTPEDGWAKVCRDHLPIVPQVAGKGQGQIGCASAHIEEACARRHTAIGYCLLAPIVMQPKAQHGVEQVIMLGNSGKHLPYSFSHNFLPFLPASNILLARHASRYIMGIIRCTSQRPSSLRDDCFTLPV